ncbi:unnamed protein product [Closterium sp. Naga37s-1]|nr:unnamed protein product [Closterium sp. Naga37s-1]
MSRCAVRCAPCLAVATLCSLPCLNACAGGAAGAQENLPSPSALPIHPPSFPLRASHPPTKGGHVPPSVQLTSLKPPRNILKLPLPTLVPLTHSFFIDTSSSVTQSPSPYHYLYACPFPLPSLPSREAIPFPFTILVPLTTSLYPYPLPPPFSPSLYSFFTRP